RYGPLAVPRPPARVMVISSFNSLCRVSLQQASELSTSVASATRRMTTVPLQPSPLGAPGSSAVLPQPASNQAAASASATSVIMERPNSFGWLLYLRCRRIGVKLRALRDLGARQ